MCRRLIFLVSLVLVLALVGNASAAVLAYWNFDSDFTSVTNNAKYGPANQVIEGTGTTIGTGAGEWKLGGGALKIDDDPLDTNANGFIATGLDVQWNVVPASPVVISTSMWFKYEDISGDGSMVRNFLYEAYEGMTGRYPISLGIRDDTDTTDPSLPTGYGKAMQYYYECQTSGSVNGGDNPPDSGYSGIVSDGQWHHTVNIWDRVTGELEVWLDGVQIVYLNPIEDSTYGTKPPVLDDLTNITGGYGINGIRIGNPRAQKFGERNFDGYSDDFAIIMGHLSAADVAYLWNGGAGNPVPEPATIALLGMGGLMLLRRKRRA